MGTGIETQGSEHDLKDAKALIEQPPVYLQVDLRAKYTARTIEALNQFSEFTRHTPTDWLDLRCEFDVARFKKLTNEKQIDKKQDH